MPFKWRKTTDYYMVDNLKYLGQLYPDLFFFYPKNSFYCFTANVIELWNECICKLIKKVKRNLSFLRVKPLTQLFLSPEYKAGRYDIVFMRGSDIVNVRERYRDNKTVVFYESFFIDPVHVDGSNWDAYRDNWSSYVTFMEGLSKEKMIINLRSDYSVSLANKMFPQAKAMFVNLFFPINNTKECMTLSDLTNKHMQLKQEESIKFLFCGMEAKRKGLINLVQAFKKLREKYFDRVELTVISEQASMVIPSINDIEGINNIGAQSHTNALSYFCASHVYIMPSLYETFGLSYIEGLAHGCIVIARDFEPQREILDYGNAGLLVDPFSIDAIFQVMERVVLMNNNERLELARKGFEQFRKKYCFDVVSKHWHETLLLASGMKG